jgi:hypothetical protein
MEIERNKIPPQLRKDSFGFVRLKPRTKIPFEQDWQNKPYSFTEIQPWIDQGGNCGLLGGQGGLIIIDSDTPEISQLVETKLPPTFTVKSPKKGSHYYYLVPEIKKKIVLKKDGVHYGEIISCGSQAVCPGSIHPDTGTEYQVINSIEIANVSHEQILAELAEYIPTEFPPKDTEIETDHISIVDILSKKNIQTKQQGDQLFAAHPIHGSTTNNNFVVHPARNFWHCFRCGSGGGALLLIAVLERILECHEALPGKLRGDKFIETLRLAKNVYGFDVEIDLRTKIIPLDKQAIIEKKIKAIPPDADPVNIPNLLDPILKEIACLYIAQGDAFLNHTIKDHFGFKDKDLKGYEITLKNYRNEPTNEASRKSLNKTTLIERLQNEQNGVPVHPAQDYLNDLMIFTVKAQDTLCLVTSDKRLFPLEDACREGFNIKHDTVDTSRFSAKGIMAFLERDYKITIADLYEKIYGYIKRFIHFPDEAYLNYVTLWIIGTYLFMIFRYYPYVWLHAEKQSGKTLLMEVLCAIAFNGELLTNPTESVIFRDISNNLITMFIDEVEQLRRRDKDTYGSLISLLNTGFNKAGTVKRTESNGRGSFTVKAYNAYSPKMFAGISEIDDVLQDRTFRIPLLRKKEGESVERYKDTPEILASQRGIRDDLYVFALTNAKKIAELYHMASSSPIKGMDHLNNRELDIWEPIMLLANMVDNEAPNRNLTEMMTGLSRRSCEEKQSDSVAQNETYQILTVLKAMLEEMPPANEDGDKKIFFAERVLDYFKGTDDFDWLKTLQSLTRRLKRVKIVSDQMRVGSKRPRVYIINIKDFNDLCERFKI